MKLVAAGQTVAAALAKEGVALPAPDKVNMNRERAAPSSARRVPPVMALLFSMAEGTVKRLEAPERQRLVRGQARRYRAGQARRRTIR